MVIKPLLILTKVKDPTQETITIDKKHYQPTIYDLQDDIDVSDYDIIYYLYDTFELTGFADMRIMGRSYLTMLKQIEDFREDLVLMISKDKKKGMIGVRD